MKRSFAFSLILIFALALEIDSKAQTNGVMASTGIATFRMDDMKIFQSYILSTYPVEGRVISSFPPYSGSSFHLVNQLYPNIRIGVGYAFTSTGGKTDYTDYSGNIHTTIITNSHRIGAYISYSIWDNNQFEFALFGKLDVNLSRVEVSSVIYAAGLSNGAINTYKTVSPNGTAGFEVYYKFRDFYLGIEGGYLADLPSELRNKETGGRLYDPTSANRILTTDWSGYRAAIKAIFWLKTQAGSATF